MTRLRFAFALAVLVAAPAWAQTTIVGDWEMTINSPQGANTTKVAFKQDGEKVNGLFKSPAGELPFTGTLTGNELKFTFTIQFQGQPLEIAMNGTVDGDAMTGKANFGGMVDGDWSAKRATDATAASTTTASAATTTAASTTTAPSTTTAGSTTAAASTTTAGSTTTGVGLAGKWDVTLMTPGGEFPANASFTEEGGKVTGTFGSQIGEVPVSGTLEGHAFKLTMTAQTPQGPMEVTMTGDVDGDAIKGKAEIAGMGQMEWTAKRAKQ
jgi:hypothetical protein